MSTIYVCECVSACTRVCVCVCVLCLKLIVAYLNSLYSHMNFSSFLQK